MAKRSIFITVQEAYILQKVWRVSLAEKLRAETDIRFIIVTIPAMRADMEQEYGPKGFIVESIYIEETKLLDKVISFFMRAGYPSGMNDIQSQRAWYDGRSRVPPILKRIVANVIGRTWIFASSLRALDLSIRPAPQVAALFEKYSPDTVFSSVLLYGAVDVPLLRE